MHLSASAEDGLPPNMLSARRPGKEQEALCAAVSAGAYAQQCPYPQRRPIAPGSFSAPSGQLRINTPLAAWTAAAITGATPLQAASDIDFPWATVGRPPWPAAGSGLAGGALTSLPGGATFRHMAI